MKIHIQNFQAIVDAEIEVEGITVLGGLNDVGKSAVIRAIKTTLMNTSKDAQKRDYVHPFRIELEVDKKKVAFGRDKEAWYEVEGKSYTRLNKQKLFDIYPEFPLQVVSFPNSGYYFPNIVGQFEQPVFSQVDIYDFFSSMFGKIGSLFELMTEQKKEIGVFKKERDNGEVLLSHHKQKLMEYEEKYDEREHQSLKKASESIAEKISIERELAMVRDQIGTLQEKASQVKKWESLAKLDVQNLRDKFSRLETQLAARRDLEQLKHKKARAEIVIPLAEQLKAALESLEKVREVEELKAQRSNKQTRFQDLKRQLKALKVCPVCGAELKDEIFHGEE